MSLSEYAASIHHDGSRRYVENMSPRFGDIVAIRLRALHLAPIRRVFLRTVPDGEQHFEEMQREGRRGVCAWWKGALNVNMPVVGYRFLLFTDDGAFWYNGSGLHVAMPTDAEDFRLVADNASPTWVYDRVFYQIFPDRFANGDHSNDVSAGEFEYEGVAACVRPWGETPTRTGRDAMVEFFGGDLRGIERRLDYVQELGVNALYLTPIFTAISNHRYDVVDYDQVDPHLGGNDALVSLRRSTQRHDIRLVLDIVPNHCGVRHPWFQSALADPASHTSQFFTFHRHPDEYACWLGVKGLPKLNYKSNQLRETMYSGQASTFRKWLREPYAIDGWRIDVANMLGRQGASQLGWEVAQGIRRAVKAEKPDAYLLGENFFDAMMQLQGDCWDAVMNYSGFAMPLWYWLSRFGIRCWGSSDVTSQIPWTTQALVETWASFRAAVPWVVARQQFNLIGSHDVARIRTRLSGEKERERIAVGLLMTYVGVPSVYYGDEIGLTGDMDTTARGCMVWDVELWDHELRAFYKQLIQLRRSSAALIEGGFQVLLVEDDVMSYLRDTENEQIIVIANRGPGTRPAGGLDVSIGGIQDGTEFQDPVHGSHLTVSDGHLPLPSLPPGIVIWQSR